MSDEINQLNRALKILKDGGTIKLGDIRLGIFDLNELTVTGWTNYTELDNLSQSKALSELDDIKNIFHNMRNICPELDKFAETKIIGYYLGQNYGQGAVGICKEIDGKIIWELELRK